MSKIKRKSLLVIAKANGLDHYLASITNKVYITFCGNLLGKLSNYAKDAWQLS